jgi:Flp pilus assembly protein TadG
MTRARITALLARLWRAERGVALVEFAYTLPVIMVITMAGAEVTSYASSRMRISQIALHVADNASRMGNGTLFGTRQIDEAQINDLFTGAQMQGGKLDVKANGLIILSSLENTTTAGRYKIAWQRCYGDKRSYRSSYGTTANNSITGMGPTGAQVIAPADGATIFVEVHYDYNPLMSDKFSPDTHIREIASMTVRDKRELGKIYNTQNVTKSSCPWTDSGY